MFLCLMKKKMEKFVICFGWAREWGAWRVTATEKEIAAELIVFIQPTMTEHTYTS